MFRGINSVNLDAKGRLALPSRYRDQLLKICSGLLVITIDINHRCLLLYPRTEWEQIERKIESLPSFDAYSGRVKHLLIGHANDLELDKICTIFSSYLLAALSMLAGFFLVYLS